MGSFHELWQNTYRMKARTPIDQISTRKDAGSPVTTSGAAKLTGRFDFYKTKSTFCVEKILFVNKF